MRRLVLPMLLLTTLLFGCLPVSAETVSAPSVSAQSAVLMDARYGLVLSEKDADRRLPMASTTKIMTALTALANAAPETVIRTAPEAVGVEGSSVYLSAGEELTLEQLLYALLLQSANDAAAAIAVGVGGSISEFADLMNAQAQRLGLTDTHFANPHGLDADGHYTTARELAVITREALSHPLIRKIVGTRRATIPQGENPDARLLVNHNRLLRTYPDAIGVKTGFTKKSGRCLVSAAERNGVTLIAVTLNAPDDWRDHTAMLDYGFTRFDTVDMCRAGDAVCSVPVTGGTAEAVPMHAAESLTAALPIGHAPIRVTVEAPHFLYAPVPLDRQTGEAVYSCDLDGDGAAEEIGRVALVTAATVERRQTEQHGFFAWLKKLFR